MTDRTVGLLGCSGALGRDLVPALLDRFGKVVLLLEPLQRLPLDTVDGAGVEVRHADVTAPDLAGALHGLDVVVNAAGLPYPIDAFERSMWEINTIGAHNVGTACVRAGVSTLVHLSSTAAVGYPPDGLIADERFDFDDSVTTSAYALTKRRAEQLVREAVDDHLRLVVLNPAAVLSTTGRSDYGWAPLLRRLASSAVIPVPPGGSAFCGARDLADAVVAAVDDGRHGRRYLVVSENLSYRELFDRLAALAGRGSRLRPVPGTVCRLAGAAGQAFNLGLPAHRRLMLDRTVGDLMTRSLFYTAAKAERELGLRPRPVTDALSDLLLTDREAA